MSNRWIILLLLVVAAAGAFAVLATFNPAKSAFFYPRCPLNLFTGLHCPGCGSLRAGHALLNGDLGGAMSKNPLFVIMMPLLGWLVLRGIVLPTFAGKVPMRVPHPALVWTVVSLIVLYSVLRNIPVYPLTLLAPH